MPNNVPPAESLQTVLQRTTAAGVIGNRAGFVTYANPAFVKLWGHTHENQVVGRHARDFWESDEHAQAIMGKLWVTGKWAGEQFSLPGDSERPLLIHEASSTGEFKSPKRLDPRARWMLTSVETFVHGDDAGSMATFTDVTGQRRAEQALRQAAEDRRALHREVQHRSETTCR